MEKNNTRSNKRKKTPKAGRVRSLISKIRYILGPWWTRVDHDKHTAQTLWEKVYGVHEPRAAKAGQARAEKRHLQKRKMNKKIPHIKRKDSRQVLRARQRKF